MYIYRYQKLSTVSPRKKYLGHWKLKVLLTHWPLTAARARWATSYKSEHCLKPSCIFYLGDKQKIVLDANSVRAAANMEMNIRGGRVTLRHSQFSTLKSMQLTRAENKPFVMLHSHPLHLRRQGSLQYIHTAHCVCGASREGGWRGS